MAFPKTPSIRYKAAKEHGGVEALFAKNRRKPNLTNRFEPEIETAFVAHTTNFPAYGQVRTSNGLHKLGIFYPPRRPLHIASA